MALRLCLSSRCVWALWMPDRKQGGGYGPQACPPLALGTESSEGQAARERLGEEGLPVRPAVRKWSRQNRGALSPGTLPTL